MRCRFLLILACLVALSTGCEVRSNVDINVASNGSGSIEVEVKLDRAATQAVPDLAQQLQRADLTRAGWTVEGPDDDDDGGTVINVRHGFDTPEEASTLMGQLSGGQPPFVGFQLRQDRTLTKVDTSFSGSVDLTKGIGSFGDDGLAQTLGSRLGFDPVELQNNLGVDWAKTFPLEVTVHLPGGNVVRSPAPNDENSWSIAYGTVTPLQASADGLNMRPLLFFGVSFLTLVLLVIVALVWRPQKYLPRHKEGGIRARDLLAGKQTDESGPPSP